MAVLPLVFLITPMITIFKIPADATGPEVQAAVGTISLLLLIVPIALPPVIAAYSVVGERDQGTLEPVLTTPVTPSELLLGKAMAAFVPSVGIAYAIYFVVLISVRVAAAQVVTDVVWHPPQLLAQLLFIPLLALWAIWVGIAISTRASDVRVAQQLATLAGLPLLGLTALFSFQVIKPSVPLAVGLALALLVVDLAAWRAVSGLFDPSASSPADRDAVSIKRRRSEVEHLDDVAGPDEPTSSHSGTPIRIRDGHAHRGELRSSPRTGTWADARPSQVSTLAGATSRPPATGSAVSLRPVREALG